MSNDKTIDQEFCVCFSCILIKCKKKIGGAGGESKKSVRHRCGGCVLGFAGFAIYLARQTLKCPASRIED